MHIYAIAAFGDELGEHGMPKIYHYYTIHETPRVGGVVIFPTTGGSAEHHPNFETAINAVVKRHPGLGLSRGWLGPA